ncbi:MAG: hypothetical protein ABW046_07090 [Actinoplanes sp.]
MTSDLLERCLATFAAGLRTADPLTFEQEARRVEGQPASPLILRMRHAVDTERAARTGGAR